MTKVDLAHSLSTTYICEKVYLIIPLSLQELYYSVVTLNES